MKRGKPHSWRPIGPWVAGILVILATLVLFVSEGRNLQNRYSQYQIERYIKKSRTAARNTIGRLSGAPYAAFQPNSRPSSDLGRAQLLTLKLDDSWRSRYLRSLIDIGTGNWERAAEELTYLANMTEADEAVLNDLGVVFLELSERDAMYTFKSLDQFEQAEKRNPAAPEAHYNRLLVLQQLHLTHLAESKESEYSRTERDESWRHEILTRSPSDEEIGMQLRMALSRNDRKTAADIFDKAPEVCRKIAMQYAMNPIEAVDSEQVALFVSAAIQQRYDDATVARMLAPLETSNRSDLIEARQLVTEGAALYLKSDLTGSIIAFDKAADLAKDKDSPFDHAWIDLNRANTEIRLFQTDEARTTLQNVVNQATKNNLKWILASAQSSYGAFAALNSTFAEMMERLEEAIRIYDSIGAPNASARPAFYVMGQRQLGGDYDGALRAAVRSLRAADPRDHVRLSSVLGVVTPMLYKRGFVSSSSMVGQESVSQAADSQIPSLIVGANTSIAQINELSGQPQSADDALRRSEEAIRAIDEKQRVPSQANIDNAKARVLLHRRDAPRAEQLLEQNRKAVEEQLSVVTWLRTETWMLLGQAYVQNKRVQDAGNAFRQAISIAEKDNDFAKTERTRVAFDDGRRELYDSAIAYEYVHGSTDAAWTYLQKYRAKIFIEQLAQFNPDIERIHAIALDRSQVQRAIPDNLQVVEYALLPDRLLIWVVTNKSFETRSVSISRDLLEEKVRDFLAKLRTEKPVSDEAADLYRVLVAPIEGLLDTNRALAIIPDRALHGMPFAAIALPENGYLVERYSLVESPTLTHLLAGERVKAPRDSVVAFASRADDIDGNAEINEMKAVYRKVSPFAGPQVTKTSFLQAMERAPVFHYAGHSAHDASDPLRSSILLDGDKPGPNSVTAVDIVGHKLLSNSVVVLSSCDSSVGNSKDGVGIRGLTSAFLISGAGSVVGSLWPVESTSTTELMVAFHRAFASEKLSVTDAMRKAQLAFLKSNPKRAHPYYWSGFVVTGNSSALR